MCEQCVINPYYWNNVLPGWALVRARREASNFMQIKDFGLLQVDAPSMVWTSKPPKPLFWADTAEERDKLFEQLILPKNYFLRVPPDFLDALKQLTLMESYKLVDAAIKKGYVKGLDETIEHWLWDYLGHVIHTVKPELESDALPHMNATTPHDYEYQWDE